MGWKTSLDSPRDAAKPSHQSPFFNWSKNEFIWEPVHWPPVVLVSARWSKAYLGSAVPSNRMLLPIIIIYDVTYPATMMSLTPVMYSESPL